MTADVRSWLDAGERLVPDAAPAWMAPLVRGVAELDPGSISRNDRPPQHADARQAAVLILLADTADGPDVLLQRRSSRLRSHAGEVSFPGGRREDADRGPVATAVREAVEETGVDPDGVDPLVLFPRLELRTGYHVTGVVAHWREPVPVRAVDHVETTEVFRIPLARLADPAVRLLVHHPAGWAGPAFSLDGMVIWGYTSEVLVTLLRLGGWERPWTPGGSIELDRAERAAAERVRR